MSITTLEKLKSYFKAGAKPTQEQFHALLDSYIHKGEDTSYILQGLAGATFMGVATPDSVPPVPTQKVFYIANEVGAYPNYGGLAVADGEIAFFTYNGSWGKVALVDVARKSEVEEKIAELESKSPNFDRISDIFVGYWDATGQIGKNESYRAYKVNCSKYSDKYIRMNGGHAKLRNAWCWVLLSDGAYIAIAELPCILKANYNLVKLPNNAQEIFFSWAELTTDKISPILGYSEIDQEPVILENLIDGKSLPIIPRGIGFFHTNGELDTNFNRNWRYSVLPISTYANKYIFVRAGFSSNPISWCWFKNADGNTQIKDELVKYKSDNYAIVKVPADALELLLSWQDISVDGGVSPVVAYDYKDMFTILNGQTNGIISYDERYLSCIWGIHAEYNEESIKDHNLCLDMFGLFDTNNKLYIGIRDTTENKRVGYCVTNKVYDNPNGVEIINFDKSEIYGGENIRSLIVTINWDAYTSNMWFNYDGNNPAVLEIIKLSKGQNKFNYLIGNKEQNEVVGYDVNKQQPCLPNQLYFLDSMPTPIYKNSLLPSYEKKEVLDINMRTSLSNGGRKIYDINEPTYIKIDEVGNNTRIFLQPVTDKTKLFFKDVQIFKKEVASLNGKSVKIMSLGDSLTEGINWNNTPVTMLTTELEKMGVNVQFIGSLVRTMTDTTGKSRQVKYEGRGGWRYRTLVGLESRFAGINQVIPSSETKKEWILGVDGNTMNDIKKYNAWLYPATAEDLAKHPDFCFHFVEGNTEYNKSYADDPTLGSYVIFDPIRYFSNRGIEIPDIVTIAFGTNEWYVKDYGGFNLEDATRCARFIFEQFRKVSTNLKIVVIPLNNFPISRQKDWENTAFPLCDSVMRQCEEMIAAGDNNIYVCPIYAQGSRTLGFNGYEGAESYVADNHTIKEIGIDDNVHMLYDLDDSNYDYRDALTLCVANLL